MGEYGVYIWSALRGGRVRDRGPNGGLPSTTAQLRALARLERSEEAARD